MANRIKCNNQVFPDYVEQLIDADDLISVLGEEDPSADRARLELGCCAVAPRIDHQSHHRRTFNEEFQSLARIVSAL